MCWQSKSITCCVRCPFGWGLKRELLEDIRKIFEKSFPAFVKYVPRCRPKQEWVSKICRVCCNTANLINNSWAQFIKSSIECSARWQASIKCWSSTSPCASAVAITFDRDCIDDCKNTITIGLCDLLVSLSAIRRNSGIIGHWKSSAACLDSPTRFEHSFLVLRIMSTASSASPMCSRKNLSDFKSDAASWANCIMRWWSCFVQRYMKAVALAGRNKFVGSFPGV